MKSQANHHRREWHVKMPADTHIDPIRHRQHYAQLEDLVFDIRRHRAEHGHLNRVEYEDGDGAHGRGEEEDDDGRLEEDGACGLATGGRSQFGWR